MHASLSTEPRRDLPQPIPERMARQPLDHRGYPTPYFVAWVGDPPRPDFRIVDPAKFTTCVKHHRCWLCGEPLGRFFAFVLGPMCAITRTSAEPPSHVECAQWSTRACPFLTRPHAQRRSANLPEGITEPAGLFLTRNPGAMAVWVTRSYRTRRIGGDAGYRGGVLITVGPPLRVSWWAEGREATRDEVIGSIESGLPSLRAADGNDPEANAEIDQRYRDLEYLLPRAEDTPT